ncbi:MULTISPECIES: DUF4365 domain-containing protein [unclassified Brevundimonas]|uniref:DUF4365 domain-containing protein n=1 Tax=unclassified Brevundimonas TaxID=2622653 RepID=UPI0025BF69AA|nr:MULTISPECIES: DUF4365 domain-containing protein [unclassified Brevundimonas]
MKMTAKAKQRSPQHLTDEKGIALLKSLLPKNWVIREYKPDYGLDFAVEVFEKDSEYPQTLGEHFLFS